MTVVALGVLPPFTDCPVIIIVRFHLDWQCKVMNEDMSMTLYKGWNLVGNWDCEREAIVDLLEDQVLCPQLERAINIRITWPYCFGNFCSKCFLELPSSISNLYWLYLLTMLSPLLSVLHSSQAWTLIHHWNIIQVFQFLQWQEQVKAVVLFSVDSNTMTIRHAQPPGRKEEPWITLQGRKGCWWLIHEAWISVSIEMRNLKDLITMGAQSHLELKAPMMRMLDLVILTKGRSWM